MASRTKITLITLQKAIIQLLDKNLRITNAVIIRFIGGGSSNTINKFRKTNPEIFDSKETRSLKKEIEILQDKIRTLEESLAHTSGNQDGETAEDKITDIIDVDPDQINITDSSNTDLILSTPVIEGKVIEGEVISSWNIFFEYDHDGLDRFPLFDLTDKEIIDLTIELYGDYLQRTTLLESTSWIDGENILDINKQYIDVASVSRYFHIPEGYIIDLARHNETSKNHLRPKLPLRIMNDAYQIPAAMVLDIIYSNDPQCLNRYRIDNSIEHVRICFNFHLPYSEAFIIKQPIYCGFGVILTDEQISTYYGYCAYGDKERPVDLAVSIEKCAKLLDVDVKKYQKLCGLITLRSRNTEGYISLYNTTHIEKATFFISLMFLSRVFAITYLQGLIRDNDPFVYNIIDHWKIEYSEFKYTSEKQKPDTQYEETKPPKKKKTQYSESSQHSFFD